MNEQQNPFLGNEQQTGEPVVQPEQMQPQQPQFTQPEQVQPQQPQFTQPEQVQPQQPQFTQPEQVQPQQNSQMQTAHFDQPQQPQQFAQQNPQMQQTTVPNGFDLPQKSSKKKALTITALIVAILVLIGGTSVGVWAFMLTNGKSAPAGQSSKDIKASATGNIFQYINKISQAKKIEGKFDVDGEVSMKSSYSDTQKIKLGVKSGEIHVERTVNGKTPDEFFNLTGTIQASAESDDYQTKSVVKTLDGEKFNASLSGKMVFKWSVLGQSNRQTLTGDNEKQIKALFTADGENQDAGREMRDFLLQGYEFKTSKNGDTTVMSINKDDLKAMAKKMEDNVKNNEEKFKTLYFKTTPDASESTFNSIVDQFVDRKISQGIEDQVLPNLHDFEYKVSYKDKGDRIEEKAELKLDFAAGGTYDAKFNLKAETTYTL